MHDMFIMLIIKPVWLCITAAEFHFLTHYLTLLIFINYDAHQFTVPRNDLDLKISVPRDYRDLKVSVPRYDELSENARA